MAAKRSDLFVVSLLGALSVVIRVLYARGRHSYCQPADIHGPDEETTRRILKGSSHLGPLERVDRPRAAPGRGV